METPQQKADRAKGRFAFLQSVLKKNKDSGLPKPLAFALEACKEAPRYLEREIEELTRIKEELLSEGREDEVEFMDYEIYLNTLQLTHIQEQGRYREDYIRSIDTPARKAEEIDRCKDGWQGTIHWVNHWGWTHDPRAKAELAIMPFKLFEFQERLIRWIEDLLFRYKTDGLVEKSRDMGVSWCMIAEIVKQFLYSPNFTALVTSYNEDLIDKKGATDTNMERMRFMIRMLPEWLLPEGFSQEKHLQYMNFINPSTGSHVKGAAATEHFGRQGRYSLIWPDEMALVAEGGFQMWTACSQSSKVKIPTSTPKGRLNKFADLKFKTRIRVMSLRWNGSGDMPGHPWRDERWYRAQSRTMNDAEKAQELDINWDASQVGLVFKDWDALYHTITKSEFADFYRDEVRRRDGALLPPGRWMFACAQDVGISADHRNVTTWAMTPRAGAMLNDSAFLWHEYVAPIGEAPELVGDVIIDFEKQWGIWETGQMHQRLNSHEGGSERLTYDLQGLDFEDWKTDFNAGIAQLKNYMLIRDRDKPHPFRAHLGLMGRPRFYVIVDDKYAPQWDKSSQKWYVPDPEAGDSFARALTEIRLYHIPASEQGKPVRQQRPMKAMDDAMDTWRALAAQFFPPIAGLTDEEYIESHLPESLRKSEIRKLDPEQQAMAYLARQMEISEVEVPSDTHWRRAIFKPKKRVS